MARSAEILCEVCFDFVGGVRTSCEGLGFTDETGLHACKAASTCDAGTTTISEATATSDTVYIDCNTGFYSIGCLGYGTCTSCESDKLSTDSESKGCTSASTCGAGTRIRTASAPKSDTLCARIAQREITPSAAL